MFMMMRTLSLQMTAFFMANSVHSCPRASSTRGRSAASDALASATAWRTASTVALCSARHLSNACAAQRALLKGLPMLGHAESA